MAERGRASRKLLEELGWLTIQWARLEAYVDFIAAYLHHQDRRKILPKAFNARVKFIRVELRQPVLLNVRADGNRLLNDAMRASRKRNDLVHGIVTQWAEGGNSLNTLLRATPSGYVAMQDIPVSPDNVRILSEEIRVTGVRLFGIMERIKSIFRLLTGNEDFGNLMRLEGDRD
jgi:hypothetical protein